MRTNKSQFRGGPQKTALCCSTGSRSETKNGGHSGLNKATETPAECSVQPLIRLWLLLFHRTQACGLGNSPEGGSHCFIYTDVLRTQKPQTHSPGSNHTKYGNTVRPGASTCILSYGQIQLWPPHHHKQFFTKARSYLTLTSSVLHTVQMCVGVPDSPFIKGKSRQHYSIIQNQLNSSKSLYCPPSW